MADPCTVLPTVRSVQEVARQKHVSPRTIVRAIRAGELTTIQVAGHYGIIPDSRLAAWAPDRARQRGARKRWRHVRNQ
jgi:hypothetical protein